MGKRVEGVLTSSAGGRGRVKQVWGRSDLFRSLGLTRGIGDEEDEEVCAAAKLRGELWGGLCSSQLGHSARRAET